MNRDKNFSLPVIELVEDCLGCKWTLHVLSQIRLGTVRPGQLEKSATGLTMKVLNERLQKLIRYEIIEKESFAEIPPRVEYHLTSFGQQVMEIIDRIQRLDDQQNSTKGSIIE